MFCGKCGSFFEGDGGLCDKCAAEQAVEQFADNTVVEAAPVDDVFELNTSAPKAPKKSPKKRGLIAGIVAGCVAVAVAVGAIFGGPYIKAFFARTFQEPEQYFEEVQKTEISQRIDDMTGSYGQFLEMYNNTGAGGATGFEGELRVTVGDELMSILETYADTEYDLDFLKDIRLSMNVNTDLAGDDALMRLVLAASLGKTQILSADVIADLSQSKVFASIPELNKQYLMVDASAMDLDLSSVDSIRDSITEATAKSEKILSALPSEEVLNKLLNNYAMIALSCIDDVEKENGNIEVGDASQKVVVMTATITEKDIMEMGVEILKEAKADADIKTIIDNLSVVIGEEYGMEVDMYSEYQASIEEVLEEVEAALAEDEFSRDTYVELVCYIDLKGQIRGYELTYSEDGEDEKFLTWKTAVKGKTTYSKLELPSADVKITGEKTEDKNNTEGFYKLNVDGVEIGKLEFETEGDRRTTLRLIPGAEIMDRILAESNLPTALLSGNMALELSFGEDESGASFLEVSVLAANKKMITVSLSAKAVDGGEIVIPSDAVDATDSTAVSQWVSNVDFQQLMDGLKKAGVDQSLLDYLQSYIDMAQGLGNF